MDQDGDGSFLSVMSDVENLEEIGEAQESSSTTTTNSSNGGSQKESESNSDYELAKLETRMVRWSKLLVLQFGYWQLQAVVSEHIRLFNEANKQTFNRT